MEKVRDADIAYILLESILTEKGATTYSSEGFMSSQGIFEKILKKKFAIEDVNEAIIMACEDGLLDLWYVVQCDSCNHTNWFQEVDVENRTGLEEILTYGVKCSECFHKLPVGSTSDLKILYTISNRVLDRQNIDDDDRDYNILEETNWQRIMRWMFGWLRKA